jgi:hypothetical protein
LNSQKISKPYLIRITNYTAIYLQTKISRIPHFQNKKKTQQVQGDNKPRKLIIELILLCRELKSEKKYGRKRGTFDNRNSKSKLKPPTDKENKLRKPTTTLSNKR